MNNFSELNIQKEKEQNEDCFDVLAMAIHQTFCNITKSGLQPLHDEMVSLNQDMKETKADIISKFNSFDEEMQRQFSNQETKIRELIEKNHTTGV